MKSKSQEPKEAEAILILTKEQTRILNSKNRIKAVYMFAKISDHPKFVRSQILWTLFDIPVIIIHDFLHLLLAALLFAKIKFNRDDSYFLKPDVINGQFLLKQYRVSFTINDNPEWKKMIIAVAPLLSFQLSGRVRLKEALNKSMQRL